MGCGMVRKVDELGRVVIPKEMRRVLNIKSGSSVEMSINNSNQVILQKFFELNNIYSFAENLSSTIYSELNLKCLVCDDEKVIICKGINKKYFLNKELLNLNNLNNTNNSNNPNTTNNLNSTKNANSINSLNNVNNYITLNSKPFLIKQTEVPEYTYIFPLVTQGFNNGYLVILNNNPLPENIINNILLLSKFLCSLLNF